MIRVALFDTKQPSVNFMDIEDNLQTYYDLINCTTIDITHAFGCDVICDDEGLLKQNQKPSYIEVLNDEIIRVLVGNIIFASHDDEGNTVSLTDSQIRNLKRAKIMVKNHKNNPQYVLVELHE